jgi:molybdopterin/thiamine biosynthesis adenylyltransferase
MISVNEEDLLGVIQKGKPLEVGFIQTDEDVFNGLSHTKEQSVSGIIYSEIDTNPIGSKPRIEIRLSQQNETGSKKRQTIKYGESVFSVYGYLVKDDGETELPVQIVPVQTELFSRVRGLLETDVLSRYHVVIKGVGSVGSRIAILLAQSGISRFTLMDDDRLELANLVRHEAGLDHIGRYKTRVMRELIMQKNPYAQVETIEEKLETSNFERVKDVLAKADLCMDAGDERQGRLMMNRICLETGTPLIISGAFNRAYGGGVFRVVPKQKTACYQCFVRMLSHEALPFPEPLDEQIAYADRPAVIEPGLSVDIDPLCQLAAKLALQQLMQDRETTLSSLDDDLKMHWYIWLNRREQGTPFESFDPLVNTVDGMRILRWYGVELAPDPECPTCGNAFASALARQSGVELEKLSFDDFARQHALV